LEKKMPANTLIRSLASFLLILSFVVVSVPLGYAQTGTAAVPTAAPSYDKGLAEIESKTEARRKELGIPGMALVIVKDDQIIFMKGLGYKDLENKVAVTPDTQFAIGSATKAFTALSVLMSADEGKLSLEDSPKKLLPYFKMYDPDTDKNITIRDLLSHSSGLNRTDLAMITGKLTRAELVEVAAQAKPTAKLREKWQYQNIMFAAAGELVTKAQKQDWEKFVPERIFKSLGMNNSTMSIKQMEKAKDHSFGYSYNFDTKETTKLPLRDIDQVAPAGSINSSARDMAEWLRFVLNGGTAGGKRIVSEKGFDEWLKPQMKIHPAGTMNYGLGWFLQTYNGMKVVQHGGNIDGFNSMVAMIPEKKLGFVMLTNVTASSLGSELMPIVWSNILTNGRPETIKLPLRTMQFMAAKYRLEEAKLDIEIKIDGEDMWLYMAGQGPYKLERSGPREFKMVGLPDGFGAKFRPETGDATSLELIQPQGNVKLPRIGPDGKVVKLETPNADAAKELVGNYTSANGAIEIKEADGKVTFHAPGQTPYTLTPRDAKDQFAMSPLPGSYFITAKRDTAGKLSSFTVTQPEGVFEFTPTGKDAKPTITADDLQKRVIDAMGGDAAWRKFTSRVVESDIDLENQGVKGKSISYAKAPNKSATETSFTAVGKTIATSWEYFDGTVGEQAYSFSQPEKYAGKLLEDTRLNADFYGMLDWRSKYKRIEVTGTAKVGDEEVYIVAFEPEKGTTFKEYYSTKSFLLLKREGVIPSSTSPQSIPYTLTYSDYRDIDGVKMPFRTVSNSISNGNVVNVIKSVKHNVPVEDKLFAPRKLQ
jgi:CubicO group peptidase (beta-lactamase class C family)